MRIVYGDVLFAVNLIVDFTLLWFIRRFGGLRARTWRLWLAAAIGAGYAVLVVLPGWWGLPVIRILVPVPLVLVAFAPLAVPQIIRAVILMYAGAFVFAGASMAMYYGRQQAAVWPGLRTPVAWWMTIGGVLLGLAAFWFFWQRRLQATRGQICRVEIGLGETRATLTGLVDTGNRLRDPLSDTPVLVAQYDALAALLPPRLAALYAAGLDEDFGRIGDCLSDPDLGLRFRLVPFSSVGRRNGLLLGFKPDYVTVATGSGAAERQGGATVCLYRGRLSPDQTYQALLPPELVPSDQVGSGVRQG